MECDAALATLLKVFEQLGLPVAMDKSEGPTQYLTFLGYQVNSQQMQVSPPQPKLENSGYSHVPKIIHFFQCLFFIRVHFDFSVSDNTAAMAVVNSGYSHVP